MKRHQVLPYLIFRFVLWTNCIDLFVISVLHFYNFDDMTSRRYFSDDQASSFISGPTDSLSKNTSASEMGTPSVFVTSIFTDPGAEIKTKSCDTIVPDFTEILVTA